MKAPSIVEIDDAPFFYREEARANAVFCWTNPGNFGRPSIDATIIAKAAEELRALTRREHVFFPAILAPEAIDQSDDDHRIGKFDKLVCEVLVALGASRVKANEVFAHVGMPSEWRGAMWRAASLAESIPVRDDDHRDLMQRLVTVCRFTPMAMTVNGPFQWVVAMGSRILKDALGRYREARRP